jgi:predicted ATPase
MLMDLFYGSACVAQKQRVHFNAFMLDVHKRKRERNEGVNGRGRKEV